MKLCLIALLGIFSVQTRAEEPAGQLDSPAALNSFYDGATLKKAAAEPAAPAVTETVTYRQGARFARIPLSREKMAKLVPSPAKANKYDDIINKYSAKNGLSAKLVKAWIAAESTFNPNAIGHSDDRGLMQLIPSTARWIAHKILGDKEEDFKVEKLYNPDYNVRLGTAYIAYLFKRAAKSYFGAPMSPAEFPLWATERVIAAYNAGPSVLRGDLKPGSPAYVNKVLSLSESELINIRPYDVTANDAAKAGNFSYAE